MEFHNIYTNLKGNLYMKLRGAIFDFDGTLFDSMSIWDTAGSDYLRSIGREPEPHLAQTLKTMSLFEAACYLQKTYAISLPTDTIINGINQTIEDFYFYTAQPKEGVLDFLTKLQQKGVNMCIATATDRYLIEAALQRCQMDLFFEKILTCSELGHGKEEPIIFQEALHSLHTKKADTLVIEDAFHAIKTAKEAGFTTLTIFDEHEEKQEEIRQITDFFLLQFTEADSFLENNT